MPSFNVAAQQILRVHALLQRRRTANIESACPHFDVAAPITRPLSANSETARPDFDVATPMMRPLSANVECARPHFNVEPITTSTCCTDYSHAMDARHGSNDEHNDERLEELHSRSPSQSKLDALIAVVNIDQPFLAAASEGSRAAGNAANNLLRQRGGFNGFSLYRRHAKQNGLKCTNSQFKQEWKRLPYEAREQYNCLARTLKNNRQVAHCAVLPVGKQGWWAQQLYGV
jgi:hypothetical protein